MPSIGRNEKKRKRAITSPPRGMPSLIPDNKDCTALFVRLRLYDLGDHPGKPGIPGLYRIATTIRSAMHIVTEIGRDITKIRDSIVLQVVSKLTHWPGMGDTGWRGATIAICDIIKIERAIMTWDIVFACC